MALAASGAVSVPLNLSGTMTTFSDTTDLSVGRGCSATQFWISSGKNELLNPADRGKGSSGFKLMNKPKIIAYLKPSCGWSQGVRAIMRKYDLPFEDRDIINDPVQRQEMIEKSGQMLSPCVEIDGRMLPDISGEEVEAYLLSNKLVGNTDREADAPTNQPCAHEMPQAKADEILAT